MSCACEFEPKIQVACGLELVNIIRSGEIVERKGEALMHAGCIVGCLGASLKGDDGEQVFGQAPNAAPDDLESCCNELEAICGGTEPEVYGLNPMVVALLLKLAELLLKRLAS